MSYLQLENLHRQFGSFQALKGIDISLGEGEFLSLLGPSGCGKTTALRLVAGFDRPSAGRILIEGKDLQGMPPNKRDMGMVFQAYSLFPNMTARQNVEFGLKIRGRDKSDRTKRVTDLLELVGLGHAGDRFPHQLSGGMQQRVALARALAIEPRVLLLDEPLSALDAKVRVQLREEIRRIQLELGITTLYVTHDQEEALAISDHVAVMYGGVIEQMGTPSEMYTAPKTPFVAEFIGTMNRLQAHIVDGAAGEVEHAGNRLRIDAARGRTNGERVLILIRPEALAISDHVAVMYGGVIEQMGTPAEMYTAPKTPFVAEFIGTMNRLEAHVVDGAAGEVDHAGKRLRIDAARGRSNGERVLILIRPETLELQAAGNGAVNGNTLTAEVVTQTFLGPVTRVKMTGGLIADMSTARASALPVGASVVAQVPADGIQLLTLGDDEGVPDIGEGT